MAASPSRLRQRSGSTPHDALTVDRRSSPHQPLSQPLDRQCTHSCQAINFAPSQIANVASQHHVSSCVAVRAGKTNSQTASIHAHQVSRRGQIPIAFAAPHRTPHRDFVPWRFLVAGRISTWIAQSCRRPKTCTGNRHRSGGQITLTQNRHRSGGQITLTQARAHRKNANLDMDLLAMIKRPAAAGRVSAEHQRTAISLTVPIRFCRDEILFSWSRASVQQGCRTSFYTRHSCCRKLRCAGFRERIDRR